MRVLNTGKHTHTQWNLSSLCFHLHLFSLLFYTLQFVWEKWEDAHTACLSSVCVMCIGLGWGMFFLGEKSNPMKAVFPLLWNKFSQSQHSSMDFLYTANPRKKLLAQIAVLCFYLFILHIAWFLCALMNFVYEEIYVNSMLFCSRCKWVADGLSSA